MAEHFSRNIVMVIESDCFLCFLLHTMNYIWFNLIYIFSNEYGWLILFYKSNALEMENMMAQVVCGVSLFLCIACWNFDFESKCLHERLRGRQKRNRQCDLTWNSACHHIFCIFKFRIFIFAHVSNYSMFPQCRLDIWLLPSTPSSFIDEFLKTSLSAKKQAL